MDQWRFQKVWPLDLRVVDDAIEKFEKLAESQLDMAVLFLSHGKADVARRRLEDLIERYGQSDAAKEARRMLKTVSRMIGMNDGGSYSATEIRH